MKRIKKGKAVKRIATSAVAAIISATSVCTFGVFANDCSDDLAVLSETVQSNSVSVPIAFPGAEGGGMFATGGRGGTVYHVTNLNDSGTGSFRDAVSQSKRIVVFDVGGTIKLKSDVNVSGNITIMGQTAPGGAGITLRNGKIGMAGDNIIVRYISSRPGEKGTESDYDAWGGSRGSNSMIDHCSLGWANDEQFGLYSDNMNQTIQYTIVGPSNCVSYHSKGAHGFGAMFGKGQNSWHHNLLCHSLSRNFRGKVVDKNSMDFVNNVIYDWGYQTAYGTFGRENYVNNYLKAGPSTRGGYKYINITSGSSPENYKFYLQGNKIVNKDDTVRKTESENNWSAFGFNSGLSFLETYFRSSKPFDITTNNMNTSVVQNAESADDAYQNVLAYCGAAINPESRTKIDAQVIEETRTGTGSLTGGRDFSTVTDSDVLSAISRYGIQYMDYNSYYPAANKIKEIVDSDNDGMPDDWETERGLNPNDASDANGYYIGGNYTNLEHYCNDLTIDSFPTGVVEKSPTLSELGDNYTKVMADYNALKLSISKLKSADDVTLSSTGSKNGSNITWSSSSNNIKVENNEIKTVTRPTATDEKAVLTAEITNGDFTTKKFFTVTIVSRTVSWYSSDSDSTVTAGTTLMDGLTSLFDVTSVGTLGTSITIDGTERTKYTSSTVNGGYSDGVGTGTCIKYTATANGTFTAYVGDMAYTEGSTSNKIFYIVPEGVSDYKTEYSASTDASSGANQKLSVKVKAGATYYAFVAGSKARFIGAKFLANDESSTPSPITVSQKWDFNSETAGTQYESGSKITNSENKNLELTFKSASGTAPTIANRSGSENYLKFTDVGSGRDGWSYVPSTPLTGEKLAFEFEFNKGDTEKDTTLLRFYDTNNCNTSNTYTTSTDGRAFELKTSNNSDLAITDYFSQGTSSTSDSQKGVDIGILDFTYEANTWYGVKLEYFKNSKGQNQIDVYTKPNGSKNYTYRDSVILGTGIQKSNANVDSITLSPTKVSCETPGSGNVTLGIDNISIGTISDSPQPSEVPTNPTATPPPTQAPSPTAKPLEKTIDYKFAQNGTETDSFSDVNLSITASGTGTNIPDTAKVCIAQYSENGVLIKYDNPTVNISDNSYQTDISIELNAEKIKIFTWDSLETEKPIGNDGEINRTK